MGTFLTIDSLSQAVEEGTILSEKQVDALWTQIDKDYPSYSLSNTIWNVIFPDYYQVSDGTFAQSLELSGYWDTVRTFLMLVLASEGEL